MSSLEDQIATAIEQRIGARLEKTLARLLVDLGGADELLTVAQAAKVAKVKPSTIRSWIRKGHLVSRGKAKGLRVSRKELVALRREDIPSNESAADAARRLMGRAS